MTIVLGRPLIDLNFDRLDKEASFRSSLIHIRENAESVMLTHGEERQRARLLRRIDDVIANIRRITAVNRNLGFFTGGYNWMIQLATDLIIAPAFIRGEIEFGVITQSGAAFAMLVGAFSLIVRQFNSISNFAAVVSRLSSLQEAIEKSHVAEPGIEMVKQDGPLTYEGLTLASSASEPPLLKELSVSIPFGTCVLVTGASHARGAALFRATAGMSTHGTGRIIRPNDVMFLPQRPYLPSGTMRELLVDPEAGDDTSDDRIVRALYELDLEHVINQAGGLDEEQNWERILSLGEQQLLALANVLLATPRIVLLDRVEMTLGSEQLKKLLRLLSERSITCINIGQAGTERDLYQAVLEYDENGRWTWVANPTINRDH
jgi:vitamin B12/bleomycin/antimicrobial peptide transport system ATP-binding/permease protein